MSTTFEVSDVDVATTRLRNVTTIESIRARLGSQAEAGAANLGWAVRDAASK